MSAMLDDLSGGGFWLTFTLVCYFAARRFQHSLGGHPLANTVLLGAVPIVLALVLGGFSYENYAPAASVLFWILGPATVALGVPLYMNFARVKAALLPLAAGLAAASLTGGVSAVLIAGALGARMETVATLAPKSVTSPIAMGIAAHIGGIPSLAAALVIVTGILGAMFGGPIFDLMRITDQRARGVAYGAAAHGIGTARAFQVSEISGTFSGVAMVLNGIASAIILPLLWLLFF